MTIFPTANNEPRPIRLKEETRQWAWESLHAIYGDETIDTPYVVLGDKKAFENMSFTQKYDAAIKLIAANAPLRICKEEKVCGAATLGMAINHKVPAVFSDKTPLVDSFSHYTLRLDKVINEGLDSYSFDIQSKLRDENLTHGKKEFLYSLQNVINSIRIWHTRYLEATEKSRPDLHKLLMQVPFSTARNFHEALQTIWFIFSFTRLCGNWPGIGRIDWLLGDFLKNDLKNGILSLDEARELLASFFIKGCEWIRTDSAFNSGDAQHYQNLVLAGLGPDEKGITNEVTYLILDVVEELGISDYPITVRLNKNSPKRLKEKVARVMRHGGGIIAVYNEDLILEGLKNLGYPREEALTFANDGCWEIQIPGKTNFSYIPFDSLQIFNSAAGITGKEIPDYPNIEALYAEYHKRIEAFIKSTYDYYIKGCYTNENGEWHAIGERNPSSVVSLFLDGSIENARSYYDFGPTYLVRSPHIGGAPDVANSFYAIQKLVFEETKISYKALIKTLKNNWEDNKKLCAYVKNAYTYYGNDNDEADYWHSRVLGDFADTVNRYNGLDGNRVKFIPGVSTFGRQIDWLPQRCATAFGATKGTILSGNDSPTPGTDIQGATAIIKSYCKSDLLKQTCGAALDIKLHPSCLRGENGIVSLIGLMDGFLSLGGFFMQIDTVDTATLIAAQKNPENYKTLSVRVSGWNARFVSMDKEWQDMIIERSLQNI